MSLYRLRTRQAVVSGEVNPVVGLDGINPYFDSVTSSSCHGKKDQISKVSDMNERTDPGTSPSRDTIPTIWFLVPNAIIRETGLRRNKYQKHLAL